MQQPLEVRGVFKAASLMRADLHAACLYVVNVCVHPIKRNSRDNQGNPQPFFLVH
ncbi:hypothetical protein [Paraburkholderia megapolitana]|uniref:hypothetical protein n=1 Tax=Paraburkholderia megapolitana TaxID=420953 RepID=UPI0014792058|nr:hypothetical protein [Paraburkholderia megapolitana]